MKLKVNREPAWTTPPGRDGRVHTLPGYVTIDDDDEGYVVVRLDQLADLVADLTAELDT